MKINELRIGNYLYLCGWNAKVVGVREDGVYVVNDLNTLFKVDITDVRPIPLTKEFFEKNGFILLKDLDYYGNYFMSEDMRIEVYESSHGWVVHIDDKECCTAFSKCLKYVHELQNAYYVSTGKEIEVKL
jgi:hypothetical protein